MNQPNNFHLIQQVHKSPESPTVVFAARFDVPSVKYGGSTKKIPQFTRRDTRTIRNIFRLRKWDIRIEVGILDVGATHHAFDPKNDCSYKELLHNLHARGYDPILPLKDNGFIEKIERVLAMKIIDANKKINEGSHHSIKEQLLSYAKEIRDYCRDYVRGGIPPGKPVLAKRTIEIRHFRSNSEPEFYSYTYGINEPLWETGQLENAIDCRVFVHEGTREKISIGDKDTLAEYSLKRKEAFKKSSGHAKSYSALERTVSGEIKRPMFVAANNVAAVIKPKNRKSEIEKIEIREENRLHELRISYDDFSDIIHDEDYN